MSSDNAPAFFGRYQVLEELGAGAMGVVYLCVDPRLARPVAIKVLKESEFMSPAEREQFRARFRHEAEAAGRLNHPGIVQIYDIGSSYLVMEFLEGRPLSALLRSGAALKVRQITNLIQRMADAIDYAHRNGIVHRDIKPANVMIMDDGGVKVMDFGVARLDTSNLTAVGTVVGSVRYMAPEQMMGQRVDGRADVFSVAAVAYELLTGCPPFPGKTITEVVSRVVHGSHIPPREADKRLPEALNGVFATAFAPRPEGRYAHALDFARDLLAAIKPVAELEIEHAGEEGARTRVEIHAPTLKGAPTRPPARPPLPEGPSVRTSAAGVPHVTEPAEPTGETVIMAAPAATHSGGVLMLDCDPPGAHVFVDGKPVGQAPLHAVDVSFGRHLVRMEAAGREPVSVAVDVKPERPLKVLTFTLPSPGSGAGTVRLGQLVPFGPEVSPPKRVSGSVPSYPETARDRGLEGNPVAEVWVSETGDVINVAIVESAGAALDNALLSAVAGWRFTPAMLRGIPVSVRMTVQHLFRR